MQSSLTLTRFSLYALSATALLALLFAVPKPAMAKCSSGEQQVSIGFPGAKKRGDVYCVPVGNKTVESNPIFIFLKGMLQFLAAGVGLAVVGGIIYGGFLYITARGNSGQTEKGRDVILNAVIGLLLFIFMFAIMNFIIPGGIFG
ncbi:MAG: hypothetical protein ACREGJ_04160 [Candidatus Saccharimonadales bacterium]